MPETIPKCEDDPTERAPGCQLPGSSVLRALTPLLMAPRGSQSPSPPVFLRVPVTLHFRGDTLLPGAHFLSPRTSRAPAGAELGPGIPPPSRALAVWLRGSVILGTEGQRLGPWSGHTREATDRCFSFSLSLPLSPESMRRSMSSGEERGRGRKKGRAHAFLELAIQRGEIADGTQIATVSDT